MAISEKTRLHAILDGEETDRPAVICPGGMMSAATTSVLETIGDQFHSNGELMADAARAIRETSGFENLGVPFCLTVESEVLGSRVNPGNASVEPIVTEYGVSTLDGLILQKEVDFDTDGRIPAVLEAIRQLSEIEKETPVIGNLTGPISLATSLMDPMIFFRLMRKEREGAIEAVERLTDFLIRFAKAQIEAGADVISIADPTATGDILGPKNFKAFVIPGMNRLVREIRGAGAGCIVHVCGKVGAILDEFNDIDPAALSFDSTVSMRKVKRRVSHAPLMGNLSTHTLHSAQPEKIHRATLRNMEAGVDIVSPACGISLFTPHENLRAMTDTVKSGDAQGE